MSTILLQRVSKIAKGGRIATLAAQHAFSRQQPARRVVHANSIGAGGKHRHVTGFSATRQKGAASQCARSSSSGAGRASVGGGGGSSGSNGGRGGGGGGQGDGSSGGLSGLWAAYLSLVDRRPVITKAVTAALLNAIGDIFSQNFVEKNDNFDWKRTGIFTFLGFILVGPALHFWYGTLARLAPQPGTKGALLRLVGDQLVFAPPFIALFFSSLLTLEGRSQDISSKLKQDWKGAVLANWKLWIPFQFINFRFVPQQLQVLAANVVAVGWNTYLSWASHKKVIA